MSRPEKRPRVPEDATVSEDDKSGIEATGSLVTPATQAEGTSPRGADGNETEAEPKIEAPPNAEEEHAAWVKKWEALYTVPFVQQIGKIRQTSKLSKPESTQKKSVYLVIHHVTAQLVDAIADCLGTYDNVSSANEHAIGFFATEYNELLPGNHGKCEEVFSRGNDLPDELKSCWDVNDWGCVTIQANTGKRGLAKLEILKQNVHHEPPFFQPTTVKTIIHNID